MNKKLQQLRLSTLFFFAAILCSALVSSIIPAQEARAEGESFRWIAPNVIEMSGGFLATDRHEMEAGTDSVVLFQGNLESGRYASRNPQLTIFEVRFPVGVDCTVALTIELDSWVWTDPNNPAQGFTEKHLPDEGTLRINANDSGCTTTGQQNSPLREFMASESNSRDIIIGSISNAYSGLSTCENIQGGSASVRDCVIDLLDPYREGGGLDPNEDVDPDTIGQTDGDEPVCTGGAMGWILCPLSTGAAGAMEVVGGIVQGLMHVQPLSIAAPETEPVYIIWNTMRNIANILFIIFFLIIIGSYITSVGISNYGIKRTLPRLVIAAILVNISYFLCAIMIDIFNIIGGSIEGLFQTGINAAVGQMEGYDSGGASGWQIGSYFVLFGGVLAAVIKVAGPSILLLLLPPLISALGAILTLFIILLARQFIVTLLVIVSPLIAVAWLLPGTEQYFKKGLNLFFSMLVSYPVVMMVIQTSSLLVAIVHVNGVAPSIDGGGASEWLSAIAILLIQVLVAFVVFKVLQTSVRIMNQLGVMGGGAISGLRNMTGGWAKERRGNSRWAMRRKELSDYRSARARGAYDQRQRRAADKHPGGRSVGIGNKRISFGAGYEAQQRAVFQNQAQERKRSESESIAEKLQKDRAYQQQFAGSSEESRMAAALATGVKASKSLSADEMSAHKLVLSEVQGLDLESFFKKPEEYKGGQYQSEAFLLAGQQLAREKGNSAALSEFMLRASQMSEPARQDAILEFEQNHPAYRGINLATADTSEGGMREKILNGKPDGTPLNNDDITAATKSVMMGGKLSAANMTGMDKNELVQVRRALSSFQEEANQIQTAAMAAADRGADGEEEYGRLLNQYNDIQKVIDNTQQNAVRALSSDSVRSGAKVETAEQLGSISNGDFKVR